MRKWWRDTRFVEFWRDIVAIVVALVLFTIPLAIAFNFVAGGWLMETERLISESEEVFQSIRGIGESLKYIVQDSKHRNEYLNQQLETQDTKLSEALTRLSDLSESVKKLSEGRSGP